MLLSAVKSTAAIVYLPTGTKAATDPECCRAARLITGARRSEHMTPVSRDLHWLPVRQRIMFKTAVLVYGMTVQTLVNQIKPDIRIDPDLVQRPNVMDLSFYQLSHRVW